MPPTYLEMTQFANNLVGLQIKTLTAFKKIGTQSKECVRICNCVVNFIMQERWKNIAQNVIITNHNIMTNLFFEICQLLFDYYI